MSNQLPEAGTWTIDSAHSWAEFAVEHFTVAFARGLMAGPSGTITVAENLESSSVTASIEVKTLNTANAKRDEHVLGPDFLDAEKYPTIDFTSRALRRTQKPAGLFKKKTEGFELDGDLTLHGVTKPVTLALTPRGVVTDTWGKTRFGLTATAELARSAFDAGEFGHVKLESGGFMLPDTVRVTLEIEATREEPADDEASGDESATAEAEAGETEAGE
ncbi:MAG: YceI family protein [Streptosporangiales bacterium]|jgi:polyisoprenoid-binding protein YceI|nr:YceI family protein [Streptosporangiales bacterium]